MVEIVKNARYCLALGLLFAFTAPVFAQDDYPTIQIAPGYGNLSFQIKNIALAPARHSGFTMGADYNISPMLGGEVFTGYYSMGGGVNLYTNTFGGIVSLRRNSHIIPFGTAGFGFASLNTGSNAMATRIGGGFDVPFNESIAIRFEATRMGFHFNKQWNSGANYSVGIVLNLSQ